MSILKIENLQKYYGSHHALKDINLEVKDKEVVVILGPSGCGKSTLCVVLMGLKRLQVVIFILTMKK